MHNYNSSTIHEEVSKTSIQLLLKEPFYGHFFARLIKEITDRVPTLAVGMQNCLVCLYINPQFWTEELNEPQFRYGVLKHEILHLVFKHIFRGKEYPNHALFNVAADLVVNQYITASSLPKGAIFISTFPDLYLKTFETADYYYKVLEKLKNEEKTSSPKASKHLKDLLDSYHEAQQKHNWWHEVEKLTSAEAKFAERHFDNQLANTLEKLSRKQRGNLGGHLQEYLDAFLQSRKPRVNWKRVLRLFAASSNKTYIKNTLKRPSRRYGTTPGIKVKHRQRILLAIDTSGSIASRDFQVFFQEIYHIWRQGAEITIVECDADIQKVYAYTGKMPEKVHGRGGTDFNPPIQYANEKHHPDAILYFTDGYGAHEVKPRAKMMWIITADGLTLVDAKKELEGQIIKITD